MSTPVRALLSRLFVVLLLLGGVAACSADTQEDGKERGSVMDRLGKGWD